MAREVLSRSQSLRVIGQRLQSVGIHAFELSKKGDEYIVRIDAASVVRRLPDGELTSDRVSRNIVGDYPGSAPPDLKFTSAELSRYDKKERLSRIKPSAMPDIDHLSVVLRVLGDYLDRNSADDFVISLSKYSTKICYDGKEQIFTAQNLYDLGILMYLRHSKNASEKQGRPATATGELIRGRHPNDIESSRFG